MDPLQSCDFLNCIHCISPEESLSFVKLRWEFTEARAAARAHAHPPRRMRPGRGSIALAVQHWTSLASGIQWAPGVGKHVRDSDARYPDRTEDACVCRVREPNERGQGNGRRAEGTTNIVRVQRKPSQLPSAVCVAGAGVASRLQGTVELTWAAGSLGPYTLVELIWCTCRRLARASCSSTRGRGMKRRSRSLRVKRCDGLYALERTDSTLV